MSVVLWHPARDSARFDFLVMLAEAGLSHEWMQSITLKVGQSSIVVDQMGVTIKGIMIKIEAMATLDAKAPLTTVKGDAMLILKGGLTLIN